MNRRTRWLLAGLLLALVVLGGWRLLAARRVERVAPAGGAPVATAVVLGPADVVRAAVQELVQTVPVSGTLRAVDTAVVKARAAGEIGGLTVREGDTVAAGQVIARVDPAEYRSRVRQAEAQADSARAQADVTQRAYDNNQALVDQGFISKTALDTSQSNHHAALSTWRAAQAAVEVARKALDDTVLRSPIAGQVAQRLVQPGERVGLDARVIEVVDLRRIEVEATLAAADSVAVRPGQRALLEVEGGGTAGPDPGGAGRQVGASVVRVNPSAQAGSRGVLVYLRLDGGAGLRQGLFAQGAIEVGRRRALAVPLSAVRTDKPAPYVQLVVDGRIAHRAVQPGQRGQVAGQPMLEVGGIDEGARVVAGGVGALREDTAVRLAVAAAPHEAAARAPAASNDAAALAAPAPLPPRGTP